MDYTGETKNSLPRGAAPAGDNAKRDTDDNGKATFKVNGESIEDVVTYRTVFGAADPSKPGGDVLDVSTMSLDGIVWIAIAAANSIDRASYCSGGWHGDWNSKGYDCSGAVSYVLGPKGAGILDSPLPSGDFAKWGYRGKGGWITRAEESAAGCGPAA